MTAWGRGVLAWNLSPGWGNKPLPPEQSSQNKLEPEPTAGHILGRRSCVPSGRGSTSPFPEGLRPLLGSWSSSVPPKPKPRVLPIWVSSWARDCHRKSWPPPSAAPQRFLPLVRVHGPPGAVRVPWFGSDPIRPGGSRWRQRHGAHRTGLREGGASRAEEAGGQGREGVRVSPPRPPAAGGAGDKWVQGAAGV